MCSSGSVYLDLSSSSSDWISAISDLVKSRGLLSSNSEPAECKGQPWPADPAPVALELVPFCSSSIYVDFFLSFFFLNETGLIILTMRWFEGSRKAASSLRSLTSMVRLDSKTLSNERLQRWYQSQYAKKFKRSRGKISKKYIYSSDYHNCSRFQRSNKILQGRRDSLLNWDVYRTITGEYAALGESI